MELHYARSERQLHANRDTRRWTLSWSTVKKVTTSKRAEMVHQADFLRWSGMPGATRAFYVWDADSFIRSALVACALVRLSQSWISKMVTKNKSSQEMTNILAEFSPKKRPRVASGSAPGRPRCPPTDFWSNWNACGILLISWTKKERETYGNILS